MEARRLAADLPDHTRWLGATLDTLGKGPTRANFYMGIMEGAVMSLNPSGVGRMDELLRTSIEILLKKNHDYGASVFSAGPLTPNLPPETAALVRLGDKYNRLLTLSKTEAQVVSETVRDTIVDVLGYSIILVGMAKVAARQECCNSVSNQCA